MEEKIKYYYWEDYIKIEKENNVLVSTIDGFLNIVKYPIKIEKLKFYELVYGNAMDEIHDIEQTKRDIPRYIGYIEVNKKLLKLNHNSFEYFYDLLKHHYSQHIKDILNFCPQQIFAVVLEEIIKYHDACFVAKTNHQLIITPKKIERVLEGEIMTNATTSIKTFRAKLKYKYNSDVVTLKINFV